MTSNRELFEILYRNGKLDLVDDPFLQEMPPSFPVDATWDRVEGMLLGIAIGDALGLPTEGVHGWKSRYRYADPLTYLPGENGPSDDTQMSFWTLEAILRDGQFNPASVAGIFADPKERIVGIGEIVAEFRRRAQHGKEWPEWTPREKEPLGNGALMRVAPVIIPYLRQPSADLWIDAALCGRITHDSSVSTAACVALVHLIWQCLRQETAPPEGWWSGEFLGVFSRLCRRPVCPPEKHQRPLMEGFVGQLGDFVDQHVQPAVVAGRSVREMCDPHGNGWGSGPQVFETLASVLFVLMRHGENFEEAVTVSIRDTRDNDTIASIVGSVLGALHGKKAIPNRWIEGLSGRTRQNDNRQVFSLIEQARRRFWDSGTAVDDASEGKIR